MCLASMLEKNDLEIFVTNISSIIHISLKYMFERNGLEIFKIEKNNVNGGSYRIFLQHI